MLPPFEITHHYREQTTTMEIPMQRLILAAMMTALVGVSFSQAQQAKAETMDFLYQDGPMTTVESSEAVGDAETVASSTAEQVDSCDCPPIVCDGETQAKGCKSNCENGKAICLCGKCQYGSFNRCMCQ